MSLSKKFLILCVVVLAVTARVTAQNFDVKAWGANASGQLGDNSNADRWVPVSTQGLSQVQMVTGGGAHSLALLSNGTVMAWGSNSSGQLGDGTNVDRWTPVVVQGLENIIAVSAGEAHSLALRLDGTVWAWGRNLDGVLGDGTTTDRWTPVQSFPIASVIEIAAGANHNLAVLTNGQLFAWGNNPYGALGDGTTTRQLRPQQVDGLINMVDVAGGDGFSLALRDDGSVFAWGRNHKGQLGNGGTQDNYRPAIVQGLINIIAISGGRDHSVGLRDTGVVWAWGANNVGQIGDGTTADRWEPVQVHSVVAATRLAEIGQGDHNLARRSDGTVWAWGLNSKGQLGNNSTANALEPLMIPGLTDVQEIGGDSLHSLAVRGPGQPVGLLVPRSPVPGGATVKGNVVLNDYSDFRRLVRITDDSPYVLMSTYAIILQYRRWGTFKIWTYGVSVPTVTTISATFAGVTQSVNLTLIPATPDLLWLSPTSMVGGNPSMGTVRLNGMAPAGGLTVTLSTSNPAVANHASNVVVSYGASTKQFPVSTFGVDSVKTAIITATSGVTSRTAVITVRPAALDAITLASTSVQGGASVTATVAMNGKTGALGRTIALSSDQANIVVPASMYVPPQKISWNFTVTTQTVATQTSGTITASQGGITKSATLTLTP